MGDEEILERSRMVVSQLALEYSVKIARNYSAAYKIIVEHQVDVMVCGPAEEQFHQNIVDAYRFMESARRLKRYRDTPMILILCRSNIGCVKHLYRLWRNSGARVRTHVRCCGRIK